MDKMRLAGEVGKAETVCEQTATTRARSEDSNEEEEGREPRKEPVSTRRRICESRPGRTATTKRTCRSTASLLVLQSTLGGLPIVQLHHANAAYSVNSSDTSQSS